MIGTRVRATLCVAVSCLLLGSCSDSAPEQQGAKTPAAAAKPAGPKPATAGAQMVAAVSAGKTATAVGVHFQLGNSPRVATALPVEIAVIAHEPFSSLRAHFESQDGLTTISGEDLEPRSDVKAETTIQHQLVLMPSREGVFMITVNVDTEGKEGIVSRIFSIPVIVAPSGAPTPPAAAPADAAAPANAPQS
jgi:hypothetical protein